MITSSQNSKLKLIRKLTGRSKERQKAGAFLSEGVRLVEEALTANWSIQFVLYSEGLSERGLALLEKLKAKGVDAEEIMPNLMKSLSDTETAPGIIAVIELFKTPLPTSLNFILVLDQIRDPGNLGTLIRSAAAAGVQAVLLPPETADAFAPKVVRAGVGAHFRLPIHSMTWDEIEQVCTSANLQIFLADMDGDSYWDTDFRNPLALIIGGEAHGASEMARKLANVSVSIPMPGNIESLNASVAAAVLIFEVVRQRSNVIGSLPS